MGSWFVIQDHKLQVIEAQVDMPIVGAISLHISLLTFTLGVHPDRLDYVDQVLVCCFSNTEASSWSFIFLIRHIYSLCWCTAFSVLCCLLLCFFLLEVESFGCSLSLLSRFQSFFVFVFEERCLFVWLTVYVLSFLALCKSLVYRIFGIIGAPCELHNTYIK
jgi:hypothetical protein